MWSLSEWDWPNHRFDECFDAGATVVAVEKAGAGAGRIFQVFRRRHRGGSQIKRPSVMIWMWMAIWITSTAVKPLTWNL